MKALPTSISADHLSRSQKAAIVLASLSAETASTIVDDISDEQLRVFAKAFSELKSVPPNLLHTIAEEFVAEVERSGGSLAGGLAETRLVLGQLAEQERVDRILTDLTGEVGVSVWKKIEVIDEQALLDYIIKQRSTIAAIILRNLNGDKCASILAMTDSEFSRSVLLEMSRMSPPSSDIIDMISDAIEKELLAPIAGKPALGDAGAIVGDIINNLPAEKRDELLEQLVEADQEIGNEVRKAVLTFEELHERLPGAAAPLLLREVDRDILMKALKYAGENAPQTLEFLLGNISKRMAEQYREELEEMAELNTDDGEKAQRQVTSVVKRLAKSAELKLAPAS